MSSRSGGAWTFSIWIGYSDISPTRPPLPGTGVGTWRPGRTTNGTGGRAAARMAIGGCAVGSGGANDREAAREVSTAARLEDMAAMLTAGAHRPITRARDAPRGSD